MTIGRVAILAGVALLAMIVNIGACFLYMVVYSYLIDPGHEKEYYHDHVQVAAPYCGVIAGVPIMFFAGWWVGGWWDGEFVVTAGLIVWFVYAVVDLGVLLTVGITSRIGIMYLVSFLTKLVAVYVGSLVVSPGD